MLQIQKTIKLYLKEREWDKLSPVDLAKSIMIEGAELLELFQWKNYTVEEINNDPELKLRIQKEMADVMIYCTDLAIRLNIDVETAMQDKLSYSAKKYPAAKILHDNGESSKNTFYMKQKMAYRKAKE